MPRYCTRCVLPDTRPGVRLDAAGVCGGCRNAERKRSIDWAVREKEFAELVADAKERATRARAARQNGESGYDCVIPVSGGKDSYWQVVTCLEHGLRPLCVTYVHPGRTALGERNLARLVDLGVDHLELAVDPAVERAFIEKAFLATATSGLVTHMAIYAWPLQVALEHDIPLVVYGENSAFEYGSNVEGLSGARVNRRWLEHFGVTGGTTAADWVDDELTAEALAPFFLPGEEVLAERDVRAVFLGHYFPWDPETSLAVARRHGFTARAEGPRVGHYDYVNIDDDMIGVHHHAKWFKFGITRTWDTLSMEIRSGRLSREEAVASLAQRGDETPWPDIEVFCSYLSMSTREYFEVMERFRNPDIWSRDDDGVWRIDGFLVPDFPWRDAPSPRSGTGGETVEEVDAVVVGATIRGLVAAYVLNCLGYRAVLVDRSSSIGGADGSFVTAGGTRFDHGLHVLDSMRSELTTRLFTHMVDGAVNRVVLRRGIALRGHVMAYAPLPKEMPEELARMLPSDDLVDDLGDDPPSRERLASCYGQGFADLVFDEVLASYPTEARHRAFGVDEALLLTNIYPWFFPRAKRRVGSGDESRLFHDRLRAGIPQEILYPRQGGFGGFAQGFLDRLDPGPSGPTEWGNRQVEVLTGADDLHVEVQAGTHSVDWVQAGGRRFRARHYFWAGGWPALCQLLGLPYQDAATDRVVLGSFRFDRPPNTDFHEILVGDPRFRINRVHFPAEFRASDEALMQIEFAFPVHEERWTLDSDEWRARWLDDARRLGLLDETHRVEDFDFRSFVMHFNGYGAEGEPLRDADPTLLRPDTNLFPVAPSMANLNLNRYVPGAIHDVTSVMAAGGEGRGAGSRRSARRG